MKKEDNCLCNNKKAYFEYEIIEKYIAGIVLVGTEIKALRAKKASFNDSYCEVKDNEVFVKGFHISKYDMGNLFNHDPDRLKKLLLNKQEIIRMKTKKTQDGFSIVPLRVVLIEGLAKMEIAIVRGKKLYDKRDSMKEKEKVRAIHKTLKERANDE